MIASVLSKEESGIGAIVGSNNSQGESVSGFCPQLDNQRRVTERLTYICLESHIIGYHTAKNVGLDHACHALAQELDVLELMWAVDSSQNRVDLKNKSETLQFVCFTGLDLNSVTNATKKTRLLHFGHFRLLGQLQSPRDEDGQRARLLILGYRDSRGPVLLILLALLVCMRCGHSPLFLVLSRPAVSEAGS